MVDGTQGADAGRSEGTCRVKTNFDLVVIGGGAAGLTAAGMSAVLGAKTLLVSDSLLGGDCTWHGCVPSKSLLKAAKVAHEMRSASKYGLVAPDLVHDWTQIMDRVHSIREHVYQEADAPPNMEKLGVEVIPARARFIDGNSVELTDSGTQASRVITSRFFIIATGSRPTIPTIEGIDRVACLTNENLFEVKEQPRRLLILGAGPIGIEMAQAFRRLGSAVTVTDHGARILRRDDSELAAILGQSLRKEGVDFQLGIGLEWIEPGMACVRGGGRIAFDAVLAATGRRPNTESLNLAAAGVEHSERGIAVDDHCRTTRKNIFACGDVTGKFLFTHMAEHTAKVAVMNAILHVPSSVDGGRIPWCTFTDPELAHVGPGEEELRKRGESFRVYRFPFSKLDRAVTESEPIGLVKVWAGRWGKILGASILGANAGEMIAEYALAMKVNAGLNKVSATIHPYPTYALGNRRAADLYANKVLTPSRVTWIKRLFRLRGSTTGVLHLNQED
jgi:pyruvate/2-oxoglutarate dehydrogenase complex dihydrolipoamide dehydrogenase (E3) component